MGRTRRSTASGLPRTGRFFRPTMLAIPATRSQLVKRGSPCHHAQTSGRGVSAYAASAARSASGTRHRGAPAAERRASWRAPPPRARKPRPARSTRASSRRRSAPRRAARRSSRASARRHRCPDDPPYRHARGTQCGDQGLDARPIFAIVADETVAHRSLAARRRASSTSR